jgi:hypothetical protein
MPSLRRCRMSLRSSRLMQLIIVPYKQSDPYLPTEHHHVRINPKWSPKNADIKQDSLRMRLVGVPVGLDA